MSMGLVYQMFIDAGIGQIETDCPQEFRGYYCFSTANRYFTPAHLAPHETYRRYPEDVDPLGALHKQYLHGAHRNPLVQVEDNQVKTFARRTIVDASGNK